MNKILKVLKGEKGFSLIELLIVIAIIAVLALLIIPKVSTSLDDSKEATNETNVKLLQSAVERFYFDHDEYPTANGTDGVIIDKDSKFVGKYIDEIPLDPWNTESGRSYELDSNGVVQKLEKPTS